jgi:hypothetical protein
MITVGAQVIRYLWQRTLSLINPEWMMGWSVLLGCRVWMPNSWDIGGCFGYFEGVLPRRCWPADR